MIVELVEPGSSAAQDWREGAIGEVLTRPSSIIDADEDGNRDRTTPWSMSSSRMFA